MIEQNMDAVETKSLELKKIIVKGRKDLWNARFPSSAAFFLSPIREFILDPYFTISSIVLPPLIARYPVTAPIFHTFIGCQLFALRSIYRAPVVSATRDIRSRAANDFLAQNKAALHLPDFQPPSDVASAFRGAIAFTLSALADVVSLILDSKKMTKWFQAIAEFKAYLDASGIGHEIDDAVYKPMIRGRLLDNLKILHDIQLKLYGGRCEQLNKEPPEKVQAAITEGRRMMRFATAAYGTEMIRSALDREAQHDEIDDPTKAIAFHCGITPEDIRILDVDDGADMNVLRHFVAIDKRSKSVILALRGTLSISGALVDMQAMDVEFCGCRAHKGMAEMADNIWKASGRKITQLFQTNELRDYGLTIVGHSLGAGTACLLNIKIFEEELLLGHNVRCFAFAPPPTFSTMGCETPRRPRVKEALNNTIAYIHDADCVPFLSVRSVQRLVGLFKAVDEKTKHIWAFRRFLIFWEWEEIPEKIIEDVRVADEDSCTEKHTVALEIAASFVVWMKKNYASKFEAYGCNPRELAGINLQVSQDMLADHLVEPYEDCLDELADAH